MLYICKGSGDDKLLWYLSLAPENHFISVNFNRSQYFAKTLAWRKMPGNNIPPTQNCGSPRSELALQQHGGLPQYCWNSVISPTGWRSKKFGGRGGAARGCEGHRCQPSPVLICWFRQGTHWKWSKNTAARSPDENLLWLLRREWSVRLLVFEKGLKGKNTEKPAAPRRGATSHKVDQITNR